MYLLYTLLSTLLLLLLSPWFLLRAAQRGDTARHLRERFGFYPAPNPSMQPTSLWIHAVSVGEVLAVLPLARALHERFPHLPLVVTTTTVTGQRLARERLPFASRILYFPIDLPFALHRAFRAIRPAAVIIVETEIWPNFLRHAARQKVPVAFVNGRLSEKSARGYRLADRLLNHFPSQVFADASLFLMRNEEDAARLTSLGAPPARVLVSGNLKYDLAPPPASPLLTWLESQIRAQERWPVVVAGSVVADEEEHVLAAFDVVARRWRHALLILAPRKPDRFDAAARIARERGWQLVRRTELDFSAPLNDSADVLLLDSIGELAALYRLADVTFIGGSLVPTGGHNILEPASAGKVPVFGPSMENFSDTARQFLTARAARQVANSTELGETWTWLIENEALRSTMGHDAQRLVSSSRGATARCLDHIARLLDNSRSAP